MMGYTVIMSNGELYHHGIKGQRWGVRRYQNYDGTLTSAGKRREQSNGKQGMSAATKKKIAIGVGVGVAAVGLTALGIYAKNNPYKVYQAKEFIANSAIKVKDITKDNIAKGKAYSQKRKELNNVLGPVQKKENKKARKVVINNIKNTTKKAAQTMKDNAKKGFKEGLEEGPRKVVKAATAGAFMVYGKSAMDKAVGKSTSDKIFQANDPKKIGKFWKVQKEDDDDR